MKIHNFVPDILDSLQEYYAENGEQPSKIIVRQDVLDSLRIYTSFEKQKYGRKHLRRVERQLPMRVMLTGVPVELGNTLLPYRLEDNK